MEPEIKLETLRENLEYHKEQQRIAQEYIDYAATQVFEFHVYTARVRAHQLVIDEIEGCIEDVIEHLRAQYM
jgi:hypothetical protein